MNADVYVKLKVLKSGYVLIMSIENEDEVKEHYQDHVNYSRKLFNGECENFEGFKLTYILLNVKFDGRKGINQEDVMKSLELQGLTIKKGESIFGRFYKPTEKLVHIIDSQLQQRKQLAGVD